MMPDTEVRLSLLAGCRRQFDAPKQTKMQVAAFHPHCAPPDAPVLVFEITANMMKLCMLGQVWMEGTVWPLFSQVAIPLFLPKRSEVRDAPQFCHEM